MSQLQKKLDAGEFVVTGEIGPPKGINIEPVSYTHLTLPTN